jgi:hypothetical protein
MEKAHELLCDAVMLQNGHLYETLNTDTRVWNFNDNEYHEDVMALYDSAIEMAD